MIKEILDSIMNALRGKKNDSSDSGSTAGKPVIDVTATNFDQEVIGSDKPVVVLFSAEWCPACVKQAPIFDKVARALSAKYKFVKIDIDKAPTLKRRYGVRAIPTLGFFKPGTADGAMTIKQGFLPEDKLKATLASTFKN